MCYSHTWKFEYSLNRLCFMLQDRNGSIENEELNGFLKDLMELVQEVMRQTREYHAKVCLMKSCWRNIQSIDHAVGL